MLTHNIRDFRWEHLEQTIWVGYYQYNNIIIRPNIKQSSLLDDEVRVKGKSETRIFRRVTGDDQRIQGGGRPVAIYQEAYPAARREILIVLYFELDTG